MKSSHSPTANPPINIYRKATRCDRCLTTIISSKEIWLITGFSGGERRWEPLLPTTCTCGLMPVRNLPETKPPAPGAGSYGWKHGKDFPEGIRGGLRPSSSIWPSRHEIWENAQANTNTHVVCILIGRRSSGFIVVRGRYLHGVYSRSLGSWLDHQLEIVVRERGVESNGHAYLQTHKHSSQTMLQRSNKPTEPVVRGAAETPVVASV